MKKQMMIMAAIIFMAGLSLTVSAQTTENTDAGAKIVEALTLTENAALHFGTMTVPSGDVEVELSTAGSLTASVPANITLLSQTPIAQNAAYTVGGTIGSTYVITLPAGAIQILNGAHSMDVFDFTAKTTSLGDGTSGDLGTTGSDTFVVGATLELTSGQEPGVYSGNFNVSVNYN